MNVKLFVIPLLLVTSLANATPDCLEGNAIPPEHIKEVKALGGEWMENAVYCDFGVYQVLVPKDPETGDIALFRNGEIFILQQRGFGINLFQNYGKTKHLPYLSVQDLDGDETYETLDYSIVDNVGKVIGNVKDKGMNGDSIVLKYKK